MLLSKAALLCCLIDFNSNKVLSDWALYCLEAQPSLHSLHGYCLAGGKFTNIQYLQLWDQLGRQQVLHSLVSDLVAILMSKQLHKFSSFSLGSACFSSCLTPTEPMQFYPILSLILPKCIVDKFGHFMFPNNAHPESSISHLSQLYSYYLTILSSACSNPETTAQSSI